jgi:hypothetical protein
MELTDFIFNGKPDVFLSIVKDYAAEHKLHCRYPNFGPTQHVDLRSKDVFDLIDVLFGRDSFDPNHTAIVLYIYPNRAKPRYAECEVSAIIRSDGITSNLRCRMKSGDWIDIEAQVMGIINFLCNQGWLIDSDGSKLATVTGRTRSTHKATLARVQECHRLIKQENLSLRTAIRKAKTHHDTYRKYCKEATGEQPY